ncbi:CDC50/LEM3 family [Zopfochytrium polystomum]|nr:CDC50/LEM3 family [Zopfochytrium polystomum]
MNPNPKANRPSNTAFKQQRLKAWQPILTPKGVLPAYFAVGSIFIPIGVWLYLAAQRINEVVFDYTSCATNGSFNYPITNWSYSSSSKNCTIDFNIDLDMAGPVYLYYRLTNFYQNHRRYVKSFDSKQLANSGGLSPSSSCDPMSKPTQLTNASASYPWVSGQIDSSAIIYPCGLIANSYFTDVISDIVPASPSTGAASPISFSSKGIAWPADAAKYIKSTLPSLVTGNLTLTVFPPPQWVKAFPGSDFSRGYTADNFPDISTMERLHVWMRPAGLPNFRKTWGSRSDSVPAGSYRITITQNFDVSSFGGTKAIAISTMSSIGGKNPFLGVAYMTIGVVCWLLGILFLLKQMIKPRKVGVSWNHSITT